MFSPIWSKFIKDKPQRLSNGAHMKQKVDQDEGLDRKIRPRGLPRGHLRTNLYQIFALSAAQPFNAVKIAGHIKSLSGEMPGRELSNSLHGFMVFSAE